MKKRIVLKSILAFTLTALIVSCSDDDDTGKDLNHEYGWSETMRGNDPEEIAWPDQSENYWEYTMDATEYKNVGLRFKGTFPTSNTRFFK